MNPLYPRGCKRRAEWHQSPAPQAPRSSGNDYRSLSDMAKPFLMAQLVV